MHERRRLERVIRPLLPHLEGGEVTKMTVDEREKPVGGLRVPARPGTEKRGRLSGIDTPLRECESMAEPGRFSHAAVYGMRAALDILSARGG